MGEIYKQTWVRVRDGAAAAELQNEHEVGGDASRFVLAVDESPPELIAPPLHDFGMAELSRKFGEALWLFYYDGPAGELCGTILYEHAVDGRVIRAMAYACGLWWKSDEPRASAERVLWRRLEGEAEAWEKDAITLEPGLRLELGSEEPHGVQDMIVAGVRRHFKLGLKTPANGPMKCPQCGYDNAEDALSCNLCQAVLRKEQKKAPAHALPPPAGEPAKLGSIENVQAIMKLAMAAVKAERMDEARRLMTRIFVECTPNACRNVLNAAADIWLDSLNTAGLAPAAAKSLIDQGAALVAGGKLSEGLALFNQATALAREVSGQNMMFPLLLIGVKGAAAAVEERRRDAQYKELIHRAIELMAAPGGKEEAASLFGQALALLPDPPRTEAERKLRGRVEAMLEGARPAGAALAAKASTPLAKGDVLNGIYEIRGVLGEGGFGVVYLVFDRTHEEAYAFKTFREEFLKDQGTRDLFRKEAQILVDLGFHPNLVQAHFVLESSGRPFIALDYIAPDEHGLNTLDGHLKRRPPDLGQSLRWAVQFCHAMEYADSHGVRCHRDIKPANIMIDREGRLRISDFGLAGVLGLSKALSGIRVPLKNGGVGLSVPTAQGASFGTPTHMPPEQFLSADRCDARSDVYAFGVVLYQIVNQGKPPFFAALPRDGSEAEERRFWNDMLNLHCEASPPALDSPIFPIIVRCLRKKPDERFQSFKDLRAELEAALLKLTGETTATPDMMSGSNNSLLKGYSLSALGRYEEALRSFDRALSITDKFADPWVGKGLALQHCGRMEEALACFEKAVSLNVRSFVSWNNKAGCLIDMGRFVEALACAEESLRLDATVAQPWLYKGDALSKLKRYPEALSCYDESLRRDARFAGAWAHKGTALMESGGIEEALRHLNKALEIDPTLFEAWGNKAVCLIRSDRYPEAIPALDHAIALGEAKGKPLAAIWYRKAFCFHHMGRMEQALECYAKSEAIDARYGKAKDCVACRNGQPPPPP